MSVKFAILAVARSGSSYLTTTLRSHPDIYIHGEIFHENTSVHIQEQARNQIDLSIREKSPIKFVREIYNADQGKKAVGFKIWKSQNLKAVNYIIKRKGIKKIVLERKNLLASFSSLMIARQTQVWNLSPERATRSTYKTPQIKFNKQAFLKYARKQLQFYNFYKDEISASGQDYLLVDYQKHIMNENLDNVLNFLKLGTQFDLTGNKVKLNKQSNILDRFVPEDHHNIIECLEEMNQTNWVVEYKS